MKVSLNWLKQFIDISDIKLDELVESITMAGLEVDSVIHKETVNNLVVGFVKSCEKHPNADKLNLCVVTDGVDDYQVVCGASNVKSGIKVAFAKEGACLPGNFTIKKAKIRGVESFGMLCSEKELGLSQESEGIIIFDEEDVVAGSDVNPLLGLGDVVLEFGITPDRGDCLSIYGIARDIAAIFNKKLLDNTFDKVITTSAVSPVDVKIEDKGLCPFYSGRVIRGVQVKQSPLWMRNRIKSAGLRPVNSIVDITNYVMLEYGQPTHAFDLAVIDKGIIVRRAHDNEELVTLDGKKCKLDSSACVIADHSKVLGLAGVMGGEYSGISETTQDVFLECAYFTAESVSATSKKVNIKSDSSFRYARGINPSYTLEMLDYVSSLIVEFCGGKLDSAVLSDGSLMSYYKIVTADKNYINNLIGVNFSDESIIEILSKLGIKTEIKDSILTSMVPTYRHDIKHGADIAGEIARIYGINKIPVTLPKISTNGVAAPVFTERLSYLRQMLISLGFYESINYSFMGCNYLELFDDKNYLVPLLNPLSEEMDTLRTYVYPGIIKSLIYNWNQGVRSAKFFEFAKIFKKDSKDAQPLESMHLGIGFMGSFKPLSWDKNPHITDSFYYLKGVCDNILKTFKGTIEYRASSIKGLHPGKTADILLNGEKVGFIGSVHPDLEEILDIKHALYIAEFDYDKLISLNKSEIIYVPLSKFPSVYKDLSFHFNSKAIMGDVITYIKEYDKLVQNVTLFDIYTGTGTEPSDNKSAAFRIWFSSTDKTLSDEIVNPLLMRLAGDLEINFGLKLR